jgi:hypothetical protein
VRNLAALAILGLSLFAFGLTARTAPPSAEAVGTTRDHTSAGVPVIVELFTSEGCSSCPPADAQLAELEQQQPVDNAQIVALEEHVDYWNELGWLDPFSSKEWTFRQQEYAAVLKNRNVYTPQIVVDGGSELVGGHQTEVHQLVREAASRAKTQVSMTPQPGKDPQTEQLSVSVGKLAGNKAGDTPEVWLAITEAGLHSAVTRGENAGQDLHHASVLRTLRKIGVAKQNAEPALSEEVNVKLERAWKRENLHAVVFVQEKKSRQILGAGATRIQE